MKSSKRMHTQSLAKMCSKTTNRVWATYVNMEVNFPPIFKYHAVNKYLLN